MRFSIVIATCNRPASLTRTLDAVRRAVEQLGDACEIVVVDNGSREYAEDIVQNVSDDGQLATQYIRSEQGNKSAALNAGIKASRHEWIAFTDDDTLPDDQWLVSAAGFIEKNVASLFGGRIEVGDCAGPLPGWLKAGRSGRVPMGPALVDYYPLAASGVLGEKDQVPLGANFFAGKKLFEKHGGYDEDLWRRCGRAALGSEDAELGIRMRAVGEDIGYCVESLVVHPVYAERATLCAHWRWAYYYGFRDPILFNTDTSRRYLVKSATVSVVRMFRQLFSRDCAAAVCEMMECAKALGSLRGREGTTDEHG